MYRLLLVACAALADHAGFTTRGRRLCGGGGGRSVERLVVKELAPLNIPPANLAPILVTLDTFQLLSGWLKEFAWLNIRLILLTLDTFHLLSGWL